MSTRLYAQLQPDPDTVEQLVLIQQKTPARGRFVVAEKLHLTIIHFGIIDEVVGNLGVDKVRAREAVTQYVEKSQTILKSYPIKKFRLQPIALDLFGEYGSTLVIRYEATPGLLHLHAQLLEALKQFFSDCAVQKPEDYMSSDTNFKHALTLNPHITIAKGYKGNVPKVRLSDAILETMKFVY